MGANDSKNSAKKVTVVGFGPRLLSTLIDGALVGFLGFMLAFVIGFIAILVNVFRWDWEQGSGPLELLTVLSVVVFSIIYYVGSWTGDGQTLGKTAVGLRVVGSDGSQLTTGKALLRYIGYFVNATLLSIGFLWAAFDPKRQGWHDKIASTVVLYMDDQFSPADEVDFVPSDVNHKGWIWGFLWLFSALFLPIGALAGLVTVGPFITVTLVNLVRNIF